MPEGKRSRPLRIAMVAATRQEEKKHKEKGEGYHVLLALLVRIL